MLFKVFNAVKVVVCNLLNYMDKKMQLKNQFSSQSGIQQ